VEAGIISNEGEQPGTVFVQGWAPLSAKQSVTPLLPNPAYFTNIGRPAALTQGWEWGEGIGYGEVQIQHPSGKRVITHKGRDTFEVLWSTEVSMSKELKKPIVDDIIHVELRWQASP
jgi:hypothetical protein